MEENSSLPGAGRGWKGSSVLGFAGTALLAWMGHALLSDLPCWQSAGCPFPCLSLPGSTGARCHSWHGAEQLLCVIKVAREILALFHLLFQYSFWKSIFSTGVYSSAAKHLLGRRAYGVWQTSALCLASRLYPNLSFAVLLEAWCIPTSPSQRSN